MRRTFIHIMALLLTLIGLLGNAAAMERMTQGAHPNVSHAVQQAGSAHTTTTNHTTPAHDCCADNTSATGMQGMQHQGNCANCGLCHTALQGSAVSLPRPALSPALLRPAQSTRFASATLAQAIKPPIF